MGRPVACLAQYAVAMLLFLVTGLGWAHSNTGINVHGDCNLVIVGASVVLSKDFQFSDDCADPKWITEEYTRVFGADGVPPLMLLQEAGGRYVEQFGSYLVENFRNTGGFNLLSEEAIQYWKSEWPHKEAWALNNMPLWSKYSGNLYFVYWSNLLSRSHSKESLLCYLGDDPLLGQGLALELPYSETNFFHSMGNSVAYDLCGALRESDSIKVGFTFLTLQNTSERHIDEIEIVYRYHKQTDLDEQIRQIHGIATFDDVYKKWSTSQAIDETIAAAPENLDVHQFLKERLGDNNLLEFMSRSAESKTRRIAALAPGEKVIMLLNVFYTDQTLNFLPGYYIDGTVFVDKLAFRAGKRTVTRNIRDPFGKEAARKSLSWGWASQ